jgi:hypothetical protein
MPYIVNLWTLVMHTEKLPPLVYDTRCDVPTVPSLRDGVTGCRTWATTAEVVAWAKDGWGGKVGWCPVCLVGPNAIPQLGAHLLLTATRPSASAI